VRTVSEQHIGRPRRVVADLPAYRPGKGAKQAEAEHGIENAIKLASNENPSEPLDPIVTAIRDAASGLNRYADHRATAVREAMAGHLGVEVERVTVGNGSVGLLQQIALTYLDPATRPSTRGGRSRSTRSTRPSPMRSP
jgi:histidinol-phosphate aminotransferase